MGPAEVQKGRCGDLGGVSLRAEGNRLYASLCVGGWCWDLETGLPEERPGLSYRQVCCVTLDKTLHLHEPGLLTSDLAG